MVATNKILLSECTGEGCGGDNDICTDSRVHRRNAENRAPVTRNHRSAPLLGRWPTRDPIGYQGGINLYGYVDSSPVGTVDASGLNAGSAFYVGPIHYLPQHRYHRNYGYQSTTRKDLRISFTPAPQHWGGTSGNLALKQTQSELRADFADIVKEIYEAYTEGQE